MLGISIQDIEEVKAKKWPQSATMLLLEYCENLFSSESPLYIRNSRQKGVLRENDNENDFYLLKNLLLNLDRQNYTNGNFDSDLYQHALQFLPKTLNYVVKNEVALHMSLGALIKDCMFHGQIMDLNNPAIQACHEALLVKLQEAVRVNPIIPGDINLCIQAFLRDLREASEEKTADVIHKFLSLASLIARDWEANKDEGEPPQVKAVSVLLGPCLFKALQLVGKILDSDAMAETYVFRTGMLDILLSMDETFAKDLSIVNNFNRHRKSQENQSKRFPREDRPQLKQSAKCSNLQKFRAKN